MMMILGDSFVFKLSTILPDSQKRSRKQTISVHSRLGQRAILQHLGPGEDEITLSGKLFPGEIGTSSSLDELDAIAERGEVHRLIDDQGAIRGKWMIDSIDETRTNYDKNSNPREIDFNLKLRRSG